MDLQQYEPSKERVLVEEKKPAKTGSGRPTYKQEGVKYIKVANDLRESTLQDLKMALAGRYFGKKQAEVIDEAIVYYLKYHK